MLELFISTLPKIHARATPMHVTPLGGSRCILIKGGARYAAPSHFFYIDYASKN